MNTNLERRTIKKLDETSYILKATIKVLVALQKEMDKHGSSNIKKSRESG